MDALLISRLQFAFTILYHVLWPTFTIGIAAFIVCLNGLWWRTGRTAYRDLMRFWSRLFALAFGMGVITGIVISYELGTNWSGYSRAVSNALGPLLMYEVMTAFFLEAGFIGIMLFGEGRVGRGVHFFACAMVAVGTLISASWILAANSWMQTPAGVVRDAAGIFHVESWLGVIFNPSFPYRFLHMVCGSFLTCAFIVAGVSAFHLWRGRHLEAARIGFSMAMWAALVLAPLQIVLGDLHGLNTREHQPVKLAAMEGLWETGRGIPAVVFAWPDMEAETNRYELAIPQLGSLYLTHSWTGEVQGLKSVPPSDRPYVPIVFFAFRIMAGIGILLLATAVTAAMLRWRGTLYQSRWFQFLAMGCTPLGLVAVLAGWTVTEVGRQPFVIYGYLRTEDALAPVAPGAFAMSLILFFIVYNALLLTFLWFAAKLVLKGPSSGDQDDVSTIRPGLDRAGPTLGGSRVPRSPAIAFATSERE